MLNRFFLEAKYLKDKLPKNPNVVLRYLQESQYWPREKMEACQLKHINQLLKKSVLSSEYYGNAFKSIALPFASIKDFALFAPPLTKKIVREKHQQLCINPNHKIHKKTTSGSTGEPLVVFNSGEAEVYRMAGHLLFRSWWGVGPYDKSVFIWGWKTSGGNNTRITSKIKQKLRNRYDINVFKLNSESIYSHYKAVESFQPTFIRGYKSALIQFAELLVEKKLKFYKTQLKVIIVTSEVLLPEEKAYMEKTFGCRVANEYGSAESGLYGFDCPDGLMHLFEEAVYMHTDINGDAYATEYFNDVMPLINYKNNDKLIISDEYCSCGRSSRIIKSIEGRVDDYIICPNGSKISQYLFYYIAKELVDVGLTNSVQKYRITQKQNTFVYEIIPGPDYTTAVEEYIEKRMKNEIGAEIIVDFNIVETITREKSGKLRFFRRE